MSNKAKPSRNDAQLAMSGATTNHGSKTMTKKTDTDTKEIVRILITPAKAHEFLSKNHNNRPVTQADVNRYAIDMAEGRWLSQASPPIAIGKDGSLYNGQHRLFAVIKANVAVWMEVWFDAPEWSRALFDNGNIRTASHTMAIMDGVSLGTNLQAAITAAHLLATHGNIAWRRERMQYRELSEAYHEHIRDVKAILDAMNNKHEKTTSAAIVGTLAIIHRSRGVLATQFAELMHTGADLSVDSPVLKMRDYARDFKVNGGQSRDILSLHVFSAFEAFENGEPRKQVKASPAARTRYLAAWHKSKEAR